MCRDLELSLRFVVLHVGVWGLEALRWAGDFAASACTRRRVSRFRAPVVIPRCMMCTLPSEGVSFCLSAAAKSLLNKKADVKVRELVSSSPICKPVFFSPFPCVLGCPSTMLKSFCVPNYFYHPVINICRRKGRAFDEITFCQVLQPLFNFYFGL